MEKLATGVYQEQFGKRRVTYMKLKRNFWAFQIAEEYMGGRRSKVLYEGNSSTLADARSAANASLESLEPVSFQ